MQSFKSRAVTARREMTGFRFANFHSCMLHDNKWNFKYFWNSNSCKLAVSPKLHLIHVNATPFMWHLTPPQCRSVSPEQVLIPHFASSATCTTFFARYFRRTVGADKYEDSHSHRKQDRRWPGVLVGGTLVERERSPPTLPFRSFYFDDILCYVLSYIRS